MGTTFVDVDKARDFDTENAFPTRFDVGNFVNVTNVYGSLDMGFVSGETDAFKKVDLYKEATSSRGSANSGAGASITSIGRVNQKVLNINQVQQAQIFLM